MNAFMDIPKILQDEALEAMGAMSEAARKIKKARAELKDSIAAFDAASSAFNDCVLGLVSERSVLSELET